ncbi:MAG TPA: hypothetical protein VKP59_03185 [Candidatus Thermoplasmatota archaeon]|nr:hypothetical protein [Candidatus Thermoplasmatota archaeon]
MGLRRSLWNAFGKQVLISCLFIIIFFLSIDVWNWNKPILGLFGFPLWIWYEIMLTLTLVLAYFAVIRFIWTEEEP